jgi:hypothetical protein
VLVYDFARHPPQQTTDAISPRPAIIIEGILYADVPEGGYNQVAGDMLMTLIRRLTVR